MRLLYIEDSERLQRAVTTGLRKAGYAVDAATNGDDGYWMAESREYDIIILDVMIPGQDGFTILRRLREAGKQTHVLLLTARDSVEDRVRGLKAGADDYLVKPFAFEELVARVQAMCRRAYGRKESRLVVGDLEIDQARRTASRGGQPVSLTPREFNLLEYLASRRGEVVSRTEIEHHIYDDLTDPFSNVVDSAVCALRKKITIPGSVPLIHTRRGAGYLLDTDPA